MSQKEKSKHPKEQIHEFGSLQEVKTGFLG